MSVFVSQYEKFVALEGGLGILRSQYGGQTFIEWTRSENNASESVARKSSSKELRGRGNRMLFSNPHDPQALPCHLSGEVRKGMERQSIRGEQPIAEIKEIPDCGKMFEDVVAEYDVKTAWRKIRERRQAVENAYSYFISGILCPRPGNLKARGVESVLPKLIGFIPPGTAIVEHSSAGSNRVKHLNLCIEVER